MEEAGENLGAQLYSSSSSASAEGFHCAAIFRRLNSLRLLSLATAAVFKLPRERCWLS